MKLDIGDEHGPEKHSGSPVSVWKLPEPPPRKNVLEGLVPDGAVTILYGDGGLGKSYLALWIATGVCLGRPIFGRQVEKRPVLFIDAEMDEEEFGRRAYRVARGIGLNEPPKGLYYWHLATTLDYSETLEKAHRISRESGTPPVFVIVDSLSSAYPGVDLTEAKEIIPLLVGLQKIGTVLAIDHIRHQSHQKDGAPVTDSRPFGSVFKYHLVRSAIQVTKAKGGGLTLRQTKANFGAPSTPLYVALEFSENSMRVDQLAADDDRLAG